MNEQNIQMQNENVKETKQKKKGKLILIVVGVICFLGLAFLFLKKITANKDVEYKATPAVNVTHIRRANIQKEISLIGTILPSNTYYVPVKVAGEITKICVKNGDFVKKGDPICEIDASKEIEAAFIQYDTAKKSYVRMQKLYQSGDISLQSFETVKAQYDAAKLAYDTKVEYATPVAVGDGVVENTNMTINTTVSQGTILCYITSDDGKEINFAVTERILPSIKIGDKVRVEKNGKVYDAYVTDVGNLINTTTGLFDVKAIIVTQNNFASGVMAKVSLYYDRKENTYVIPNENVYYENGNAYVYVVNEDNILNRRYIAVGVENKDECEVLSGLNRGDRVVSTWNSDLAEGVVVNVVRDETPSDDFKVEEKTETIATISTVSTLSIVEEESIEDSEIIEIKEDDVTTNSEVK